MPITLDWIRVQYFMQQRGIEDANELAVLAETHRSSMHRVSTGKSLPNMQTLARMCFYLGCQPGDLLNYEHSELDLSQPHLLFGLFPIHPKIWEKFCKLDRRWRQDIGRWELKESADLVELFRDRPKHTWDVKWKEGPGVGVENDDGEILGVGWIDIIESRWTSQFGETGIKDSYDEAGTFATIDVVLAIEEAFFKYALKKNPPKPGFTPSEDFKELEQLEAVYENDPVVLVARRSYREYCSKVAIGTRPMMDKSDLTTTRLGCEIERDWHMLSHYMYLTDLNFMKDYVVNHAMPIYDMDKLIRHFNQMISTHAERAEAEHRMLDEALAENIARGMDDKEG